MKLYFRQIIVNLPSNATGIARTLKTFNFWVFFGKTDGHFFKVNEGGKFAVKCVSNSTTYEVFWDKIRKF